MNRLRLIGLSVVFAVVIVCIAGWYHATHPVTSKPTQPATTLSSIVPTTTPSTQLATPKPKPPKPTTQLLDIARANNPKYLTTQPLDTPVELRYADRLILSEPLYLDSHANLWITRHDAPANFDYTKAHTRLYAPAVHVVRDQVVFVVWSVDKSNTPTPHLVVRDANNQAYELVDQNGRRPLADPYGFQWNRAIVLTAPAGQKDQIIVPTATGVCAFTFDQSSQDIQQSHHALVDSAAAKNHSVHLVMDLRGVIAYVTDASATHGNGDVARYAPVEGTDRFAWTTLTDAKNNWPKNLVHCVPLLDGSVLQIVSVTGEEKDKVSFSISSLEAVKIDEAKILILVDQLSASDPEKRIDAFNQLTLYGPGIGPILEKALDEQPPESQVRIRLLLKNKIEPSLGGMSLVDGRMRVVSRFPDGGVLFFSEAGVAIPRPDNSPAYVPNAWLSIRPGRSIELLAPRLVSELNPDKQKLIAWASEWIVQDPVLGPQRFIGNRLEPLLQKQFKRFDQFVGIDQTGRWIFQSSPASAPSPSTHATTASTHVSTQSAKPSSPLTLILDPLLPDPTPRLPAWELPLSAGPVGWDKNDWPVIYMDKKPAPVPWALEQAQWRVLDEKTEKVSTVPPDPTQPRTSSRPTATARATTSPATTQAATQFTTQPAELGTPLLVDQNGVTYFGGRDTLAVSTPDGQQKIWTLPNSAVGTAAKPALLHTKDNLLFLFNEPGRIIRIRPTPDEVEPFTVEAVFTAKVPTSPDPLRIWLDPADRICIARDKSITVFFPSGRIPPSIAEKMPADDTPPEDP